MEPSVDHADAPVAPDAATRLNHIVGVALVAQDVARADDGATLDAHLETIGPEFVGFGVEGAAMGLTMLDVERPSAVNRADQLLHGQWGRFAYIIRAGIGLGLAEVGQPVLPYAEAQHDVTAAFSIDGYAFHLGFRDPAEHLGGQTPPPEFQGPALHAFDHGLARSLWFACAAQPPAVISATEQFAPERRDDLWSGIGFAATYAGGLDPAGLRVLVDGAAGSSGALAAGAALASHTRTLGSNALAATSAACAVLADCSADEAHQVCIQALGELGDDVSLEAFGTWHLRIREDLRSIGSRA